MAISSWHLHVSCDGVQWNGLKHDHGTTFLVNTFKTSGNSRSMCASMRAINILRQSNNKNLPNYMQSVI